MASNRNTIDGETYRELIKRIRNADWESEDEDKIRDLTDGVVEDNRQIVVRFTHPQTDAVLKLVNETIEKGMLCEIKTVNVLDRIFEFIDDDSRFVRQLSEVHRAVGQRYQTEYIEPVSDPSIVHRGQVPIDFDDNVLAETINACLRAGQETDRCHSLIFAILENYKH